MQTDFLLKFWVWSGAKVCTSCRAWKMLSNAYFLAKCLFESFWYSRERARQKFAKSFKFHSHPGNSISQPHHTGGLVLCCIKTKFCKKICVCQHFSSSTRCAHFCTAAISNFSKKIGLENQQLNFAWQLFTNSANFANHVAKAAKFCRFVENSAK